MTLKTGLLLIYMGLDCILIDLADIQNLASNENDRQVDLLKMLNKKL
jgi:hypothetical protein